MNDEPFTILVIEALNLMHPRFARADGLTSIRREFYHQFRHLWDRALPVQLGLGHVVLQADPELGNGPAPDFLFWKLSERGAADERLGAVSFAWNDDPATLDLTLMTLNRVRKQSCYPQVICVVLGTDSTTELDAPGVVGLRFDLDRWQVAWK